MTIPRASRPPGPDLEPAEAEIRLLVEGAVRVQGDVEPFLDLHGDDIVIVNVAGRRVIGKPALRAAMTQGLRTKLANVITRNEIVDITFVSPSLAIVSCTKRISDTNPEPDGSLPTVASLTYVVSKEHETWLIALAQTTPQL